MKSRFYLIAIMVLSALLSVYSWWIGSKRVELSDQLNMLWWLIGSFAIAYWINADAREKNVERFVNFSYLVIAAWPVVLPYYLFKTRNFEGLVLFVGFVALQFAPALSGLIAYSYFEAVE